MSRAPRFGWHRGRVRPIADCSVSVLDRGLLFSESIYEVLPIVGGRVLLWAEHAARMRAGAAALGLAEGVPDGRALEALGRELVTCEELREGTLYAQVTGGVGPRAHIGLPRPAPTFFAFAQVGRMPRADALQRPCTVVTVPDPRWGRCDLKTTMLLPTVLARREARAADEVLFVGSDGTVAEGGSSSVLVVEEGRVVLPPLSPRVLPSVTRALVLTVAAELGIETLESAVSISRLCAADEVGLASTTKLVLNVGTVDGRTVRHRADGVCARLAGALRAHYGVEPD